MLLMAHLTKEDGVRKEQSLCSHCVQTAQYAAESVRSVGLYHTAYLAGLLHDMGKATREFNTYLEKAFQGEKVVRGSVNHTFTGVIYLLEQYHSQNEVSNKWNCLTSEIVGYAIGAHHGLFDGTDLEGNSGFLYRLQKNKEELLYEEAVQNYFSEVISEEGIQEYFFKAVREVQIFAEHVKRHVNKSEELFFEFGLLSRVILSAVIYGDRRDTSEFMEGRHLRQEKKADWGRQQQYLEDMLSRFDAETELNRVRNQISEQCLQFADHPTGIYRMNVPTGGGKTLCTLRYALAHAEKFQKERIIFIIPLLSILDQNAQVIRNYIADKEILLEHHSNVVRPHEGKEELDQGELMTENWDAPIIISTMVQLLNILFSHETSAVGRMRALCNSVIVIDEIQTLPKKVTLMFNVAMNFLSQCCNTTVILSSATQPCLEEVRWPICLADTSDMVHLNQNQLDVFKRAEIVDVTNPYGMDIQKCTDFAMSLLEVHDSLLVICNTKAEARQIHDQMQSLAETDEIRFFHLSTSMCQQHRMEVLAELQRELTLLQERLHRKERGCKIVCVATQLVEAGVDFSFESVIRIMAGIDNLAQAAGRCNRSNEYGKLGKVYLINLKNENLKKLPEILCAQNSTRIVLEKIKHNEGEEILGEFATKKFYEYLFREVNKELKYPVKEYGGIVCLADLLANQNQYAGEKSKRFILRQPFKTVGQRFQVFEDNTVDVIVPYGKGVELIKEIKEIAAKDWELTEFKKLVQQIKMYTISIYQWQKEKLDEYGFLETCFENRLFILSPKVYSDQHGLEEIEEQKIENFII